MLEARFRSFKKDVFSIQPSFKVLGLIREFAAFIVFPADDKPALAFIAFTRKLKCRVIVDDHLAHAGHGLGCGAIKSHAVA